MATFSISTSGSIDLQALATALQPYLSQQSTSTGSTGSTTPPATGVFWIYYNGQFNWAGDYSFGTGPINYQDTAGKPLSGQFDISVPVVSPWGGYQPFAQGGAFDTSPYKYLLYSIKPTKANAVFATGFAATGDVADGTPITTVSTSITKYGPAPVAGQWGSYKIPLADFGLTNKLILKFSIADGSGISPNQFYVDNVGFSA